MCDLCSALGKVQYTSTGRSTGVLLQAPAYKQRLTLSGKLWGAPRAWMLWTSLKLLISADEEGAAGFNWLYNSLKSAWSAETLKGCVKFWRDLISYDVRKDLSRQISFNCQTLCKQSGNEVENIKREVIYIYIYIYINNEDTLNKKGSIRDDNVLRKYVYIVLWLGKKKKPSTSFLH